MIEIIRLNTRKLSKNDSNDTRCPVFSTSNKSKLAPNNSKKFLQVLVTWLNNRGASGTLTFSNISKISNVQTGETDSFSASELLSPTLLAQACFRKNMNKISTVYFILGMKIFF